MRKIFNKWNESYASVIFILFGGMSVFLALKGYNYSWRLVLLKVLFFIQFFQLGKWFRDCGEKMFDKIPTIIVCVITIFLNFVLLYKYQDIAFAGARMTGFIDNHYFLPLLSSISGIAFWLAVVKYFAPILKDNKLLNYISEHTFSIMMNHVTFMAVLNWILVLGSKVVCLPGLDVQQIKTTAWYRYNPAHQFYFLYFICGLFGSLLLCKVEDYILCKVKMNCVKLQKQCRVQ